MQWRLLMRRVPDAVDDGRRRRRADRLGGRRDRRGATCSTRIADGRWRLEELTVNYRTPAEVMDLATALLEAARDRRQAAAVGARRRPGRRRRCGCRSRDAGRRAPWPPRPWPRGRRGSAAAGGTPSSSRARATSGRRPTSGAAAGGAASPRDLAERGRRADRRRGQGPGVRRRDRRRPAGGASTARRAASTTSTSR